MTTLADNEPPTPTVAPPPVAKGEGMGVYGLGHELASAGVVLVPVPWEATTSYGRGTARGPEAILLASTQVDLFDVELGEPHRAGIVMLEPSPELLARSQAASATAMRVIEAFDAGRDAPAGLVDEVNEASRWLDDHLRASVERHLDRSVVGVVGGDHSVAYASIAALAARHPGMGVLHFDAHADLRVAYQGFVGSHASVMHRVASLADVGALVSVGLRDLCIEEHRAIEASEGRIRAFFDAQLARRKASGEAFASIAREIAEALPEQIYLSFDIDGLDPVLCPHTGTPVLGGLSFHEAMAILDAVVVSGRRIVGFDLCEVAPGPDGDEWDANVGARILYKMIGYTLRSREARAR